VKIMTQENNRQQYLRKQAAEHPSMQPQDVYKLIFQATFGAEHLLQDVDAAYEYFQKEYQEVVPGKKPLWEQIGDTKCKKPLNAICLRLKKQSYLIHQI